MSDTKKNNDKTQTNIPFFAGAAVERPAAVRSGVRAGVEVSTKRGEQETKG